MIMIGERERERTHQWTSHTLTSDHSVVAVVVVIQCVAVLHSQSSHGDRSVSQQAAQQWSTVWVVRVWLQHGAVQGMGWATGIWLWCLQGLKIIDDCCWRLWQQIPSDRLPPDDRHRWSVPHSQCVSVCVSLSSSLLVPLSCA